MNDHLNFFIPYQNAPAGHENQLTRALLVVLRYCPMAHQAWFRLVAPDKDLHTLSKADFQTQRMRVIDPQFEAPEEEVPGVSVWLAPDASKNMPLMTESDRQQVLDGIVNYGNEFVVVIENKIGWSGITEQPHQINLHGAPVRFDETPRSVSWQDLLKVFSDLVEHNLVTGAEQMILTDLLDFAEKHFSDIGPFTTLARCNGKAFRIERRLDSILGEAMNLPGGQHKGERDLSGTAIAALVRLKFAEDKVRLLVWPGDTLGQARAFYRNPTAVSALLHLQSDGWIIDPNFHWGFMAPGYAWAETPLSVEDYCNYWVKEIGSTRELARSEWGEYWTKLECDQVVGSNGREAFDKDFTDTKRNKAHPRPGLECEYQWELKSAQHLDSKDKFVKEVRFRLNQILECINAPLVPYGPAS